MWDGTVCVRNGSLFQISKCMGILFSVLNIWTPKFLGRIGWLTNFLLMVLKIAVQFLLKSVFLHSSWWTLGYTRCLKRDQVDSRNIWLGPFLMCQYTCIWMGWLSGLSDAHRCQSSNRVTTTQTRWKHSVSISVRIEFWNYVWHWQLLSSLSSQNRITLYLICIMYTNDSHSNRSVWYYSGFCSLSHINF